ncbi:hypothetical protein AUK10_00185 [Candidatus Gracilibacteria bacterium CG2_30_37_12]|nr:MAG: hypothetical protein AUK10_00185 [Candidatus Gracilibacteria bacterium CG2_30_37_12]
MYKSIFSEIKPLHQLFTLAVCLLYKKEYIGKPILTHISFSLVKIFLKTFLSFFILSLVSSVFAATNTDETVSGTLSGESIVIALATDSETVDTKTPTDEKSSTIKEEQKAEPKVEIKPVVKQETEEQKKDKEKTINDINTFLIESYKIKVDKILANLNLSIERVTNNNPIAQAQLLEKIRSAINVKIQTINSRDVSENRRKILSSVFSYIQANLDAKISQLVGQK